MSIALVQGALKQVGIDFDFVVVSEKGDRFTVEGVGDLTFDKLAELSRIFGTTDINIGCDTGTGSDPCHSRQLHVNDVRR